MPIDPGRLERLDEFLHHVTPTLALQLARAVEVDRLRGGALPHEEILGALRPRLREAGQRLPRLPTPRRLICAVFEDLLVDDRLRKQRGRIARSSIAPVWDWLTGALAPAELGPALEAVREKLVNGGADFADAEVGAFQRLAAAAILAAVPTPDIKDVRCAAAVAALGPDVAADAHDMARMMEMADDMRALQRATPRPLPALNDDDIAVFRAAFDRMARTHPDCASYVAFFVLARLRKPWEALRLAGALTRKSDDVKLSRTDLGQIGEALLADLEDCIARLTQMRASAVDSAIALAQVSTFAEVSTGIVRELGIRRDGAWGRRMTQLRGEMADEMERLLSRAAKDIAATLPTVRRGGFGLRGVRRVPDLSRSFDPQKAERALELAKLIAGSRPHALAGAFAGLLTKVDEAATANLRRYAGNLIDEVHAMGLDGPPGARRFVDHAIALTAALDGQQDADTLRRRVNAALAIAPAAESAA